jgi:hypothetical protein
MKTWLLVNFDELGVVNLAELKLVIFAGRFDMLPIMRTLQI